jgi:glycosyltransferase involved in cell wall biosynthesis
VAAEDSGKVSKAQRLGDVIAIECLDRHYRRICQGLLRERFDGGCAVSGKSIMLIGGSLGPGGTERQTVVTLAGLAASGYRELSLLCVHLDGKVNSFYRHLVNESTVSVSELRWNLAWQEGDDADDCERLQAFQHRLPEELKDIPLYAREILARKPGLVHTWLDEVNVKAGLAAILVGVRRVVLGTRSVAPDNFALFKPYMREGYRALLAQSGVVLLNNSAAGARDYEDWLGLPRNTVRVVRNGFDFSLLERGDCLRRATEVRARSGIPAEAPVVGSVLRFSEEKQPLLWIDVAELVWKRRRDVVFLMVGDGPLREEARRRAEAKGFGHRVIMPGNETDVAATIAAMDVLLLTSRMEGLPNVAIEAQALGVPIVTTAAGGAAETLDEGRTGFAVPHCAERLAQAVLCILGDAAWRQAARIAAPLFVRDRFSMARMVDQTLDAYLGRGMFVPMLGERAGTRRETAR